MSFTAADVLRWLNEASSPVEVRDADGRSWDDSESLARVELDSASLDSRRVGDGVLFAGVQGENVHGADFLAAALERGASAALVDAERTVEGIAGRPVFVVPDARTSLTIVARGYLATFGPRVVGITGSNGKTTTKDLLRAALRSTHRVGANPGNLNSRWGVPLAVLGQSGNEETLVLEMGASEPGEIGRLCEWTRPQLGCITNVAPAHLEGFGDVRGVLDTKAALIEQLPHNGVAILNRDDQFFDELRERAGCDKVVSFGTHAQADVRIVGVSQEKDHLALELNEHSQRFPVFGEANALNVAAASALALELGVDLPKSLAAMSSATLSPHRSRLFDCEDRTVLDDCYNANPVSMQSALESLASLPVQGRRVAVIGTMGELGDREDELHESVVRCAVELGIDEIVGVGDVMRRHVEAAGRIAHDLPSDPAELGHWLAARSERGDALLFKASRSVGLEAALEVLVAKLGCQGKYRGAE